MKKALSDKRKIIFFDGICHLCDSFIQAVLLRDKSHNFLYAPLQGTTAKSILNHEFILKLNSLIYYEEGLIYSQSTAVIKILAQLGGPYSIFLIFLLIPRFLRDSAYSFVARNRYTWFGTKDLCRIPSSNEKKYILP